MSTTTSTSTSTSQQRPPSSSSQSTSLSVVRPLLHLQHRSVTLASASSNSLKLQLRRPHLNVLADQRRSYSDSTTATTQVFKSPFYELRHCEHCYPAPGEEKGQEVTSSAPITTTTTTTADTQQQQQQLQQANNRSTLTTATTQPQRSLSLSDSLHLHHHLHHHHQQHSHSHSYNMSTSTSTSASTPTAASTLVAKKPPTPGQGILVPASKVHTSVKTELLNTLSQAERSEGEREGQRGRVPKLVGILATDKEDAANYAEFTRKSCTSLGIQYELRLVGAARKDQGDQPGVEIGVEEAILEANEEDGVDGIMVYYPIHGGSRDQYLQQCVSPLKDVEGLHHQFLFNLYHNIRHISPSTLRPIPASHLPTSTVNTNATEDPAPPGTVKSILPCTPLAIVKVLEFVGVYNKLLEWGDRARGKVITVINRSEVVGRPLAALLANDGARVLSVDIDSIVEFSKRPSTSESHTSRYNPHHIMTPLPADYTLQDALRVSDVVISAVPHKDYKVKTEWLKDGCICVNVAGDKNFEADVRDKASIYVPSVGQMTIAMLQRNLLRLRKYRNLMQAQEESPF